MDQLAHALLDAIASDADAIERLRALLGLDVEKSATTPVGWMDTNAAAKYAGTTPAQIWKAMASGALRFEQDRPGAKGGTAPSGSMRGAEARTPADANGCESGYHGGYQLQLRKAKSPAITGLFYFWTGCDARRPSSMIVR